MNSGTIASRADFKGRVDVALYPQRFGLKSLGGFALKSWGRDECKEKSLKMARGRKMGLLEKGIVVRPVLKFVLLLKHLRNDSMCNIRESPRASHKIRGWISGSDFGLPPSVPDPSSEPQI